MSELEPFMSHGQVPSALDAYEQDTIDAPRKVTPPALQLHARYDASDSSDNDAASPEADMSPTTDTVPPLASDALHAELGPLYTAAQNFEAVAVAWPGSFTVQTIVKQLEVNLASAYSLLAVLEVLEMIVPRGKSYKWRGKSHVSMLLTSDKFTAGVAVQQGIATPKVCRAVIPHLVANEGQALTVEELTDRIWQSQSETEHRLKEAELQQQRALAGQTRDILAVLTGLGYVKTSCMRPQRKMAFELHRPPQADIVSPQGRHQSSRMRSMRHMFDGPLPSALDKSVIFLTTSQDSKAAPPPRSRHGTKLSTVAEQPSAPARGCAVATTRARQCAIETGRAPQQATGRPAFQAGCTIALNSAPPWAALPKDPGTSQSARCSEQRGASAGPAHAAGALQQATRQPPAIALPEEQGDEAATRTADESPSGAGVSPSTLRRLRGARPGLSPAGFSGRAFAGVHRLRTMFETTRLSQAAPPAASKVQARVKEIEGPKQRTAGAYRRNAETQR